MAPNEHEFHESDQKFLTPGLLRPQTTRFSMVTVQPLIKKRKISW